MPCERPGLSAQCGFASSVLGNGLSVEDEKRKLRLLVENRPRRLRLVLGVRRKTGYNAALAKSSGLQSPVRAFERIWWREELSA